MEGRRILIAGCGYVGRRLSRKLTAAGADVYELRRSPGAAASGATIVRADLGNRQALKAIPQPIHDVVFSAAPSTPDEEGYRRIFVDGLRNLVETLAGHSQPPARLLFTSSTAVYGQSDGEWIDESSPTRPQRFNGRVLLEAESLVRDGPIPGCALRLGGIYGPGRTRRMEQVRERSARLSPGAPHYTNRIHREDAAGLLLHLSRLAHVEPVYLGVDGEPSEENEVTRFLARELGLPTPGPAESAPPRRSGSKRCRNHRVVESGYRFVYPSYREGYRALLRGEGS